MERRNKQKASRRSSSKEKLSSKERLARFRQNHLLPIILLIASLAFVVCIVAITWEGPGITSAFVVEQVEVEEAKDPLVNFGEFFSKAKQYWEWTIPLELAALFSILLLFYGRKMARLPVSSMPPKKRYKRCRRKR